MDTPLINNWLAQFEDKDISIAKDLFDSMILVTLDELVNFLKRSVGSLLTDNQDVFALYAVREIEKAPALDPISEKKTTRKSYKFVHKPSHKMKAKRNALSRSLSLKPYFEDDNRKPLPAPGKEVGSEGIIADVITQLERENQGRLLNHPPIKTLKKNKCRNIVLLDDASGSGKRIKEFLNSMLRNRYLKSWRSIGKLKITIICYSIDAKAEAAIALSLYSPRGESWRKNLHFIYNRRPIAGPALWDESKRDSIIYLCKKYGEKHGIQGRYWLGFGSIISVLVFSHCCPNNVPGILWSKTASWTPLFHGKSVPQQTGIRVTENMSMIKERIGVLSEENKNQRLDL